MADHFSALKRARQTETKTTRNRANKSRLRSALRSLREAIAKGEKEAAQTAYRETVSVVDKGVQKGILHKNTASRYKARLSAKVKAIGTSKYFLQFEGGRKARLLACLVTPPDRKTWVTSPPLRSAASTAGSACVPR